MADGDLTLSPEELEEARARRRARLNEERDFDYGRNSVFETDSPDEAAFDLRASEEKGIPRGVVAADREGYRAQEEADNFRKQTEQAPRLGDWLRRADNYAVARDDTESLVSIEQIASGLYHLPGAMGAKTKDVLRTTPSKLALAAADVDVDAAAYLRQSEIRNAILDAEDAANEFGAGSLEHMQALNDLIGTYAGGRFKSRAESAPELQAQILSDLDAFHEVYMGERPQTEGATSGAIVSGGESIVMMVPAILTGLITRSPTAASGVMGGQVALDERTRARREGLSPEEATRYGLIQGAIEMAGERFGLAALFGRGAKGKSLARRFGETLAREQIQEQPVTVFQDLNEWLTLNPERTLEEYIRERPMAAYETAVATLVASGAMSSGTLAIEEMTIQASDRARRALMTETEQSIDALMDGAEAAKLRKRSPGKFKEAVETMVEDTGAERVVLDLDGLEQSLEGTDLDVETTLEQLNVSEEALLAAVDQGGEVEIGTADLLASDVLAKHRDKIQPHVRTVAEGDLTPSQRQTEIAERLTGELGRIQEITEETLRDVVVTEETRQSVRDMMAADLEGAGVYVDRQVETLADATAAMIETTARKYGMEPKDFMQRYAPTIRGVVAGQVLQARDAGVDFENVLEQATVAGYEGTDRGEAVEWLSAQAKGLDMSQEARMARAQEMGFDTETVLYHGTAREFDSFDPEAPAQTKSSEEGSPGEAVFLTDSSNTAEAYARRSGFRHGSEPVGARSAAYKKTFAAERAIFPWTRRRREAASNEAWRNLTTERELDGGAKLVPVHVRLANPLVVRDFDQFSHERMNQILSEARQNGHDGVLVENFFDEWGEETQNYTIVFDPSNIRSVNAAFDPDYSDSANLLHQDPPRSLREASRMDPQQRKEWYDRVIEEKRKDAGGVPRTLEIKADTKNLIYDDVTIMIEGPVVEFTVAGAHFRSGRDKAKPDDVRKAVRVMSQVSAILQEYLTRYDIPFLEFAGATPAHAKLYRSMLERFVLDGYQAYEATQKSANIVANQEGSKRVMDAPFSLKQDFVIVKDGYEQAASTFTSADFSGEAGVRTNQIDDDTYVFKRQTVTEPLGTGVRDDAGPGRDGAGPDRGAERELTPIEPAQRELFQLAGPRSKQADKKILKHAKKMARKKKSRQEIWDETAEMGQPWYRDENGDWITEFEDRSVVVKSEKGKVEEVIEYPALYEAYPQIGKQRADARGKKIVFEETGDPDVVGTAGTYNPSPVFWKPHVRISDQGQTSAKYTAVHELQHAIDALEKRTNNAKGKAYTLQPTERRAFNVMYRHLWTMEERIAVPPWETEQEAINWFLGGRADWAKAAEHGKDGTYDPFPAEVRVPDPLVKWELEEDQSRDNAPLSRTSRDLLGVGESRSLKLGGRTFPDYKRGNNDLTGRTFLSKKEAKRNLEVLQKANRDPVGLEVEIQKEADLRSNELMEMVASNWVELKRLHKQPSQTGYSLTGLGDWVEENQDSLPIDETTGGISDLFYHAMESDMSAAEFVSYVRERYIESTAARTVKWQVERGRREIPPSAFEEILSSEHMIDLDAPLSGQSERVRGVLQKLIDSQVRRSDLRGYDFADPGYWEGMKAGKVLTELMSAMTYESAATADPGGNLIDLLQREKVYGGLYLPGGEKEGGPPQFQSVLIFDRKARTVVRDENQELLQTLNTGTRGSFNPDTNVLTLFEGADLSTTMHEMSHWYLDLLQKIAESEDAPAGLTKELAAIEEWYASLVAEGKRPELEGQERWRDMHETFAESFEAYLREGKAPTNALKKAFQAFKDFLTRLYRSLTQLERANLTPEIRDIFDRMLASDDQITAATKKFEFDARAFAQQMLDEGVITERQFKNVGDRLHRAREKAKEELLTVLMDDYMKGDQAWYRKELARITGEVAREFDRSPEGRALNMLGYGVWMGDDPDAGQDVRDEDVLYQGDGKDPEGFYSALERKVSELSTARAPVDQWISTIEKLKGVKKEELEWTGIIDMLKARKEEHEASGSNQPLVFEKTDIVSAIQQKGVRVETIEATEDGGSDQEVRFGESEVWEDPEAWEWRIEDMVEYIAEQEGDEIREEATREIAADDQQYIEDALGEDATEDQIMDYARSEFADEIESKFQEMVQERAEESAKADYYDNPIYIIPVLAGDGEQVAMLLGNDDQGWDVRTDMNYRSVVRSDIWSQGEAEVQAREWAAEEGYAGGEVGRGERAQWMDYVTDGDYENYREFKLTLPEVSGEFVYDSHFSDPNIVAWARTTDRRLVATQAGQAEVMQSARNRLAEIENIFESRRHLTMMSGQVQVLEWERRDIKRVIDGRMSVAEYRRKYEKRHTPGEYTELARGVRALFIDEAQSDWHQQGRQNIYDTLEDVDRANAFIEKAEADLKEVEIPLTETRNKIYEWLEDNFKKMSPWIEAYGNVGEQGILRVAANSDQDLRINARAVVRRVMDILQGNLANPDGYTTIPLDKVKDLPGPLPDLVTKAAELGHEYAKMEAVRRKGEFAKNNRVPNAPFKGDAWINLLMKKMILQAVGEGKDAIAWADSQVVKNRWSDRYAELYENMYDKKMVKAAQKLLGAKAKHLQFDGAPVKSRAQRTDMYVQAYEQLGRDGNEMRYALENDQWRAVEPMMVEINTARARGEFTGQQEQIANELYAEIMGRSDSDFWSGEQGYWIIPLTPELRGRVKREGFSLFQSGPKPAGWGPVTPPPEIGPVRLDLKAAREQYGEEAVRRLPSSVKNRSASAEDIKDLVEDARQTAKTLKKKPPQTLLQFLRSRKVGGIADPNGELKGRDASSLINNKSGMDIDYAREAAEEAGFISGMDEFSRSTIQDLLDAIDSEIAGNPVYRADDVAKAEEIKAAEARADWYNNNNVDIYETNTNKLRAQLKDMISENDQGALDPDTLADMFGFRNGEHLLEALSNTRSRGSIIKRTAEQRMKEEFGDPMNDGTMTDRARELAENDIRARQAEIEMDALRKALGVQAEKNYAKMRAREALSLMSVKEIEGYRKFLRNSERHMENALEAAKKGDTRTAMIEKQRQVVNLALFREASKLAEKHEKARKKLQGYYTIKGRREGISRDWLAKIEAVLDQFELRASKQGQKHARDIEATRKYVREMDEAGRENEVAPEARLLAELGEKKRFATLTPDEVQYLVDTIEHMHHMGKLKNKLLNAKEKRAFDAVISEMVGTLDEIGRPKGAAREYSNRKTAGEYATSALRNAHAALMRPEHQFKMLDRQDNGPIWRALFLPFSDAADRESKMSRESAKRVREIYDMYSVTERYRMFNTSIDIPELGDPVGKRWTKMDVISIALNQGVQYNRDALNEGYGWEQAQVDAALGRLMSNKDWDFVEAIWEEMGRYKDEAFALEERITGVRPVEVEGMTFTLPSGRVIEGKYYHLKYDTEQMKEGSRRQSKDVEKEALSERAKMVTKPRTRNGALIERKGSGGRPVRLSIDVFQQSVMETIHDIAYREAVIDADKIIRDPRFQAAYEEAAGKENYRELDQWVRDIVRPPHEKLTGMFAAMAMVRRNMPLSFMGMKIGTALIQATGLLTAVPEIGLRYVASGSAKAFTGGPMSVYSAWKEVSEKSEFMRDRPMGYDRDIREITTSMGANNPLAAYRRNAFMLISAMDITVSTPIWIGAYDRAMAGKVKGIEQGNEEDSIAYADSIVRRTQTAGRPQDLARVMRSGEFMKMFTMIMGYFNNLYAYTTQKFRNTRDGSVTVANLLGAIVIVHMTVPILAELLAGRLVPDEDDEYAADDETIAGNAGKAVVSNFAGMFPVVRDMVQVGLEPRFGYKLSPVASGAEDVAVTFNEILQSATGQDEWTEADVKRAVRALGAATGIPSSQLNITGDYVYDVLMGEEDPVEEPERILTEGLMRNTN